MLIAEAQCEVRTVYGMKTFAVLAAALTGAGFAIGLIAPDKVVLGGWVGGAILLAFAFGLLAAFKFGRNGDFHVEPLPAR
jgi:hypothetical protein